MGFLFSRRGLFGSISSLGDGRSLRFTSTALQYGTSYYYTVTATTPTPSTFTITWPTTHLGWILESQTGSLSAIGLTAVPNSTTTTSYSAPVTPSTPGTFFRLRRP